jgi:hypothetical protein
MGFAVRKPVREARAQKRQAFISGPQSCIAEYKLPLETGCAEFFRSGEWAAFMLSAGVLSRAGLFFSVSHHLLFRRSQDRARFGEAI